MSKNEYDLVIIGSGVAGLSAAIYAGRYKLKTLILDDTLGGYTAIAGTIENYPGHIKIDGYDLVRIMKEQAKNHGAEFYPERVLGVLKKEHCFHIATKNKSFESQTLLLTSGAKRRELGLPNEKELAGKGLHYCVTCDAPLYNDSIIGIVGGGDAAVKGAVIAAEYAKKVIILVRESSLSAEPANIAEMEEKKNKIEIRFNTEIKELVGKDKLTSVILSSMRQGANQLELSALFIEIGIVPENTLAKALGVALDEGGYVQVDSFMKTNIHGVFAAGDVTSFFGHFKQDITAAAMGAVAASSVYEEIGQHGDLCVCHKLPA